MIIQKCGIHHYFLIQLVFVKMHTTKNCQESHLTSSARSMRNKFTAQEKRTKFTNLKMDFKHFPRTVPPLAHYPLFSTIRLLEEPFRITCPLEGAPLSRRRAERHPPLSPIAIKQVNPPGEVCKRRPIMKNTTSIFRSKYGKRKRAPHMRWFGYQYHFFSTFYCRHDGWHG